MRTNLTGGAAGIFSTKIAATGFSLINSLIFARLMGARGYGEYAYAMSWVGVLCIFSQLGLDRLLVRELAVYRSQTSWGLMRGLLARSAQFSLAASIIIALSGAFIACEAFGQQSSSALITFCAAMILVPLATFMRLVQSTLQGLNRTVLSMVPQSIIFPPIFIGFMLGAYAVIGRGFDAPAVVIANIGATVIALAAGIFMVAINLPHPVKENSTLTLYDGHKWVESALPLMFIGGMYVLNSRINVIMLGAIGDSKDVAVYTVCSRGAEIITFAIFSLNAALGPLIATAHARGDKDVLQDLVTQGARLSLLAALPMTLAFLLFGGTFLSFFGPEFTVGTGTLGILCLGQLFSAFTGSVGLTLVMTGRERKTVVSIGLALAVNFALNAALIPHWGIKGAAMASSISDILINVVLSVMLYKELGIKATVFGKF